MFVYRGPTAIRSNLKLGKYPKCTLKKNIANMKY